MPHDILMRDDEAIGRMMRELALVRQEAKDAVDRNSQMARDMQAELRELRQSDVDIQLRLRELDTIKKIGWGLISLLFSTFAGLAYTTVRNDERIEELQQSIRGHVSAAGHPQSMQAINDVKTELHGINAALREWKVQKDKEVDELKYEIRRRNW